MGTKCYGWRMQQENDEKEGALVSGTCGLKCALDDTKKCGNVGDSPADNAFTVYNLSIDSASEKFFTDVNGYNKAKELFQDYCLHVASKDNFDDMTGRLWWINKRQSLSDDEIKNLHMYGVEAATESSLWLQNFKCCKIESIVVG